jgi:hypothetical protein
VRLRRSQDHEAGERQDESMDFLYSGARSGDQLTRKHRH